jgi:hypothetical protein
MSGVANTSPNVSYAARRDMSKSSELRALNSRDYFLALAFVALITLLFLLWKEALWHWFLFPVLVCGVLTGVDVVRWLRGDMDLFDPKTIIACLAFYGFFVAPLLNVSWNTFGVGDLLLWGDWRPWLGAMAALTAVGLVGFRTVHNLTFAHTAPSRMRREIQPQKFYPIFAFALTLSIAGVTTLLWQMRGIPGMVEAFENNQEAYVGKGWLLMLAWPLAALSFIFIVFAWTDHQKKVRQRLSTGLLLLSVVGIGHFLLLGWYGSRSATIWALFWMGGIVHYRFRKLPPKIVAIGVLFLIAFMYFYGFYKERGRVGFEVLQSPSNWIEPAGYQRDLKYLFLGDLARADSSASILHNLTKDPEDYNYRWGLTYAGAFTILVPKAMWPGRPEIRVEAGTEALWGKATSWRSSRLYGLGGEALLNFGPWGVVPIFGIYGGLLGWYRRKLASWDRLDARLFLAPLFTSLIVRALVYDSDNIFFFAVTQGMLVSAAVFLASKRVADT